jgi:hypothetical protein
MKTQLLAQLKRVNPAYVIMIGLAFLGTIIAFLNTPWGVLVESDSYFYISAAKNLVAGPGMGRLTLDGLLIPLTHYPPLYSLVVAGFSLLTHGNALLSARILACLLFGGNSLLFGILLARFTRAPWAGVAGTGLFLISAVTTSVVIAGLSEGLFFLFFLLALFCATEVRSGGNKGWFVWTCICAALACLARYVGLTVVAACLVGLVAINPSPWKARAKVAIIFCTASLLPISLWYLRDWLLTGSTTNRSLFYHWPGKLALNEAIFTASGWFLPGKITLETGELFLVFVALSTGAAAGAWWFYRRSHQPAPGEEAAVKFTWVLAAFILTYCLSLLVSRTFMDASTRWDTRILSPLYLAGELFFFIILWYGTRASNHLWGKIVLGGIGLYLAWLNLPQSVSFLNSYARDGLGYTNKAMQTSQAIAVLKTLPNNEIIYSNNAAAIYFNAGKLADWIPEKYDSVKAQPRSDYAQNLQEMHMKLETPGSFLVIFKPYQNYIEYPPLSELTRGLSIVKDYLDATFYAAPPN